MQNLLLLGYVVVFLLDFFWVGDFLLFLFSLAFDNEIEKNMFRFACGVVTYSYFFFFLGILHLLYAPVLQLAIFLPFLFLLYRCFQLWKKRKKHRLDRFTFPEWELSFVLLLIFIFFPLIPILFLFPTSWDTLAYHLVLPKFYLRDHFFSFNYQYTQNTFPIGIEALYGYAEALKDIRIANFITFAFIINTFVYMAYGLRKRFGILTAFISGFLFLFEPALYSEISTTPFIEYGFAFFGLIFSITLIKFLESKNEKGKLVLFLFLLTPFFYLIKFTALFFLLPMFGILAFTAFREQKKISWDFLRDQKIKLLLFVIAIGAIPALFWTGRNIYYTHNPVHPYLNNIFKGLDFDRNTSTKQTTIAQLKSENLFIRQTFLDFLLHIDTAQDYINLYLLLSFGVFMLFGIHAALRSEKKSLRWLAALSVFFIGSITVLIGPLHRYFFPMLPIILFICVDTAIQLYRKLQWKSVYSATLLFLAVTLVFVQVDVTFLQRENIFVPVSKVNWLMDFDISHAKSLLNNQDNYAMITYINSHLNPKTDQVLVLLDNRLYYYDVPAQFAKATETGYFTNPHTKNEDDVYQQIRHDGFTYIFLNPTWGYHPTFRKVLFQDFTKKYLQKVMEMPNGLILYKIVDKVVTKR